MDFLEITAGGAIDYIAKLDQLNYKIKKF